MLPELLFPPGPVALALDTADVNDAWLEDCDDADVDTAAVSVVDIDVIG